MSGLSSLWGRARERARRIKIYAFDHLDMIAFMILAALLLSVVIIRILGLESSYGLVVYALFLGALVTVMTNNISYLYKKLADDNTKQRRAVGLLEKSIRPLTDLLSLERAVKDLDRRLRVESDDEVVIEHLGIHMDQAWGHIAPVLQRLAETGGVRRVRYNLVMLRREKGRRSSFPREVRRWLGIARESRERVQRGLDRLNEFAAFEGQVRFYSEIPVIHGFRVRKPIKLAYVAMSRWTPTGDFDAGTQKYHRVDAPEVDAQGDLMAVLDAYFGHYWKEGGVARQTAGPAASPEQSPAAPTAA